MNTWEFDTTIGAGSEVVTVVYEYEQDLDSTFNESIREVWFEGRNCIGLLSDESFKELQQIYVNFFILPNLFLFFIK